MEGLLLPHECLLFASPFYRRQWHFLLSSPLLSHIHTANTACRCPCNQGTHIVPVILSTSPDPYHLLPNSTVLEHQVLASIVSLLLSVIQFTPFPHLLPLELRSPYLEAPQLLTTDPKAWTAVAAFRLHASMPHEQYALLLLRLYHFNMISILSRKDIKVINGLQAVWKGDNEQWFIFDGRPVNRVLLPFPPISLPHPTDPRSLFLNKDESFILAKLDLDSYYHRLSVPTWLHPFLGLPSLFLSRISAETRRLVHTTFSSLLAPNATHLSPVATTLPMGLSHSIYVAQSIHLFLLSRIHPPLLLPSSNHPISASDTQLSLVYIEDHCLLWRTTIFNKTADTASAARTLQALISAYADAGLPVKDSKTVLPTDSLSFLGIHLDGETGLLLPETHKLTELLQATFWALDDGSGTSHIV